MTTILKWGTIAIGGSLAVLLALGAIWEQVARRQVAVAHPALGRLVDVGGRRIQIDCRGTGTPTVVFETGLDYFGSLAWVKVHGQSRHSRMRAPIVAPESCGATISLVPMTVSVSHMIFMRR